MTHWCPVCEFPGLAVVSGEPSPADHTALGMGSAVRSRKGLPGIEPTHFCSWCPTWFRGRDRFYLTARHDLGIYGIAVWPHRQARIRCELGDGHIVAWFADSSMLIPGDDLNLIVNDFFSGPLAPEPIGWASRRGFTIRLQDQGQGRTRTQVDPDGPHFPLLLVKSWAQANYLRSRVEFSYALEEIGVEPVLFPDDGLHAEVHALP